MIAPFPPNEASRLDALRSVGILDTPPEPEYDDLSRLAASICGTPIAIITFVDSCRQWFKSCIGLSTSETGRDVAFCSHAILQDGLFIVPDAAKDPRFKDNPLVTGEPGIRFYAGMPLTTPEGFSLGTLCVIDQVPRTLTPSQQDALRVLARQAVVQLVLRRQVDNLKTLTAERERAEAGLRISEAKFRAIFDTMCEFIGLLAPDGTVLEANRRSLEAVRINRSDVVGQPFVETIWWRENPALQARLKEAIRRAAAGEFVEFEASYRSATIDFSITPVFDETGSVVLLVPEGRNITGRKKVEDALRASEERFRSVVERLAEGVFLVDLSTKNIVQANTTFLNLVGYTREELADKTLYDLLSMDREAIDQEIEATVAQGQHKLGRHPARRKDGAAVEVDLSASHVPTGKRQMLAVVLRDMTEQRRYEDRLFKYQFELEETNARLKLLAVTDSLTGMKNRAALDGKLAEEYDRAVRYAHPLSVMLIDVDHFKLVNDKFGHATGDNALREVAAMLMATIRTTDFVGRFGGEEFAAILPDTDYAGAMVLAERCRRAVAEHACQHGAVTISVGVATLTPQIGAATELVRQADEALYLSKQAGRNRVTHACGSLSTFPAPATALSV